MPEMLSKAQIVFSDEHLYNDVPNRASANETRSPRYNVKRLAVGTSLF